MRIVMTSLAVLALMACSKPAEPANDMNAVDENAAMEANAADANMATPAGFQINETSWEFTRNGKATTESVDATGKPTPDGGTARGRGIRIEFASDEQSRK